VFASSIICHGLYSEGAHLECIDKIDPMRKGQIMNAFAPNECRSNLTGHPSIIRVVDEATSEPS
jgi:hypothetical protein